MLSSAVDRREVLGVAMDKWSDIVFLQCGTQVGLLVEHLARHSNKGYQTISPTGWDYAELGRKTKIGS